VKIGYSFNDVPRRIAGNLVVMPRSPMLPHGPADRPAARVGLAGGAFKQREAGHRDHLHHKASWPLRSAERSESGAKETLLRVLPSLAGAVRTVRQARMPSRASSGRTPEPPDGPFEHPAGNKCSSRRPGAETRSSRGLPFRMGYELAIRG